MNGAEHGAQARSEISSLGEFGLINRIASTVEIKQASTIRGIGDDAAVLAANHELTLISKDLLCEGIHFDLSFMPLQHLGYKAVAVNVSDIAAMNGKPKQILVGLAISNRFSIEAVDALYSGIKHACESFDVDLVGGDTTSSASGLVISVTVLGTVAPDKVAYRSGAQVNDIICVTGDLGAAYLGLQVLEREKEVFKANPSAQPDLEKYNYIVGRQLKPEARMDVVYDLAEAGVVPTAMIDVSDGLASELLHMATQSNVGIKIFEDKIPIDNQTFDTALEFQLDPITCALNGGEDYELLFTIKQADFEKVKKHPDIHFIGHIHDIPSANVMLSKQGTVVPLRAQGWNHFKP